MLVPAVQPIVYQAEQPDDKIFAGHGARTSQLEAGHSQCEIPPWPSCQLAPVVKLRQVAERRLRLTVNEVSRNSTTPITASTSSSQPALVPPRSMKSCRSWMPWVTGRLYAAMRNGVMN